MQFNTPLYIIGFLPTVCFVFFILKSRFSHSAALVWLLSSSLFFYAYRNPYHIFLLTSSIGFNYLLTKIFLSESFSEVFNNNKKTSQTVAISIGIATNLIILACFKYWNFFKTEILLVQGNTEPLQNAILPLAISFFTFQQIAYLVDCFRDKRQEKDFLNYALFVSFFPQLVSGPIVHHSEMMPQFADKKNSHPNTINIVLGISIFFIGLFKKSVIADPIANVVDIGFNNIDHLGFIDAWVVTLGFTLQIYYDFSGYTDMACGAALLFNISLPRNFNSPYKALSIRDFWKRWHMTLSRWFENYLYIPLGGSKSGISRTYINILLTFLLSGLWHGAGWTFVFWGVLHGTAVSINRIWSNTGLRMPKALAWLLTFITLNILWVLFRSDSISESMVLITKLLGSYESSYSSEFLNLLRSNFEYSYYYTSLTTEKTNIIPIEIPIVIGLIGLLFKNSNQLENYIRNSFNKKTSIITFSFIGTIAGISIYKILSTSGNEFIYFNF
ncbi:MBOAT family [Verrucomicrobiia bacterium DG1235]|nr:MBOAT family [Verrucomicrobiae bacterium DG1235]